MSETQGTSVDIKEDLFQQVQTVARDYWGQALPCFQSIVEGALRRELRRMEECIRDRAVQDDCARMDFLDERARRRWCIVPVSTQVEAGGSVAEGVGVTVEGVESEDPIAVEVARILPFTLGKVTPEFLAGNEDPNVVELKDDQGRVCFSARRPDKTHHTW